MGIDINAIKGRLNKLQNTQKKSDSLWKPTPGKTQVRIAPYKFNKDNPFIELYFHYNINFISRCDRIDSHNYPKVQYE